MRPTLAVDTAVDIGGVSAVLEVVPRRPQNDSSAPLADLREGRTWVPAQHLAPGGPKPQASNVRPLKAASVAKSIRAVRSTF
jgi:hypothetical protein